MTDSITQALDEMQARCNAATEGPWEIYDDGWDISVCTAGDGTPGITYVAEKLRQGRDEGESDARFVAASRTDMPKLIAALRAVLEVVQDEYHADTCDSVLSQEDYPCTCWKSEITNAIAKALGVDDD